MRIDTYNADGIGDYHLPSCNCHHCYLERLDQMAAKTGSIDALPSQILDGDGPEEWTYDSEKDQYVRVGPYYVNEEDDMGQNASRRMRLHLAKQREEERMSMLTEGTLPGLPTKNVTITMPGDLTNNPVDFHPVTIIRDHHLSFPKLYLEVFVSGENEPLFAEIFTRAECTRAKSLGEADLVVFTGGPDVNPAYYNEEPHETYEPDHERDQTDIGLYHFCLENGIPMLGICRGAQFLHVMNGGKLYQDVDNHNSTHMIIDLTNKERIDKVSSVHHQMCRPNPEGGMAIIATANKSRRRCLNPSQTDRGVNADIEAFFYRDTCCLGIQGHPEYRNFSRFTVWTMDKIEEFIVNNPDFEWIDGDLRMSPDILLQRSRSINSIVSQAVDKAAKKGKK